MDKKEYQKIRHDLDLSKRSFFLFYHFLGDVVLFGLCYLLWQIFPNSWWKLLNIPLLFVLMFRNFSLMHEAVHGLTTIKSKKINEAVGVLSGTIAFLPFHAWKKIHMEHHYWAGNIDKDPSMKIVRTYHTYPKWLKFTMNVSWRCWVPLLSVLQYLVFWKASVLHLKKNFKSPAFVASFFFPFFLYAGASVILPAQFLVLNLAPAFFLYLMVIEVVNFPHHLELPQYEHEHKLHLWDQHEVSRSCLYTDWFARHVILNFNYHTEHHMYPEVPCYHLDKIHRVLSKELGPEYNHDLQFMWILKNRNKDMAEVIAPSSPRISPQKKQVA